MYTFPRCSTLDELYPALEIPIGPITIQCMGNKWLQNIHSGTVSWQNVD